MVDVRALRERHRLSRKQFCELFHIPARTLQSWELGERNCPLYVLRMMETLLELADRVGDLEQYRKGGADDAAD